MMKGYNRKRNETLISFQFDSENTEATKTVISHSDVLSWLSILSTRARQCKIMTWKVFFFSLFTQILSYIIHSVAAARFESIDREWENSKSKQNVAKRVARAVNMLFGKLFTWKMCNASEYETGRVSHTFTTIHNANIAMHIAVPTQYIWVHGHP